jgi:hypothetical protein
MNTREKRAQHTYYVHTYTPKLLISIGKEKHLEMSQNGACGGEPIAYTLYIVCFFLSFFKKSVFSFIYLFIY